MAPSQSPQLGYNHNIPHRGRLYHVQTEDSGVEKAHIFTHVFYDGTIIADGPPSEALETQEVREFVIGDFELRHAEAARNGPDA